MIEVRRWPGKRRAQSLQEQGRVRLHSDTMAQPLKSVLWVDDEADLLESHRIFLREKGFEVDAATNADDAVEMLRRRPYDLVLLDEQMPGKRGLEALPRDARARSAPAHRHGHQERGGRDAAEAIGVDDRATTS